MAEVTHGLRSLLAIPTIYNLFNTLIGDTAYRTTMVREYIRPEPGERVLDIGCGPGNMLPFLGAVQYAGFDPNQHYINAAHARFGGHGTFVCDTVKESTGERYTNMDLVLALGVLHHLNDHDASVLFRVAHSILRPGGRLVTLDGCYTKDQSSLARFAISRDRGRNVRTKDGYMRLGQCVFSQMVATIRHDMIRIPYTHIIIKCTK